MSPHGDQRQVRTLVIAGSNLTGVDSAADRARRINPGQSLHRLRLVTASVTLGRDRGATYLTARIARDHHPDILERMKAGEYQSVRAAALARRCTADASHPYLFSGSEGAILRAAWRVPGALWDEDPSQQETGAKP